jgi:hypothetical protein
VTFFKENYLQKHNARVGKYVGIGEFQVNPDFYAPHQNCLSFVWTDIEPTFELLSRLFPSQNKDVLSLPELGGFHFFGWDCG